LVDQNVDPGSTKTMWHLVESGFVKWLALNFLQHCHIIESFSF